MDESIAAKREARRRKILENSENRLKKITGLTAAESSIAEKEKTEFSFLQPVIAPSFLKSDDFPYNGNSKNDDQAPLSKAQERAKTPIESIKISHEKTTLTIFLSLRIHIALLAVVVRLLLLWDYGYLFTGSVFIPLATVEVLEFIRTFNAYYNAPDDKLSILEAYLSLFLRLNINKLKLPLIIVKQCLEDVFIYVFVLVWTHVLLSCFLQS